MAIRSAHGAARKRGKLLVTEVLPPDELPAGVAAPSGPAIDRDEQGRVRQGSASASALASKGGRAKAEAARVRRLLGLKDPPAGISDYTKVARDWHDQQIRHLAETVGGGVTGPAPQALIASAARSMAASLVLYDLALHSDLKDAPALFQQSARHAETQKQMCLAAHELTAREAKARPAKHNSTPSWCQPVDLKQYGFDK